MIKRFLSHLSVYLLTVCGGAALFIALSPAFSYLAYSDRPGPGFYNRAQPFSFGELASGLEFGGGFAAFLAPYAAVIGILGILIVRALEAAKFNQWVVSVLGGTFLFFGTGYVSMGIGWYISAGGGLTTVTAMLGAIVGSIVIPNHSHPTPSKETALTKPRLFSGH
jgi:hypothetical protein